jgi:hypothetical protein
LLGVPFPHPYDLQPGQNLFVFGDICSKKAVEKLSLAHFDNESVDARFLREDVCCVEVVVRVVVNLLDGNVVGLEEGDFQLVKGIICDRVGASWNYSW